MSTHEETHSLDDVVCRYTKELELYGQLRTAANDAPGSKPLQNLKNVCLAQLHEDTLRIEATGYNIVDVLARFGTQTFRAEILRAKETLQGQPWSLTDPAVQTDLVDEDRILRERADRAAAIDDHRRPPPDDHPGDGGSAPGRMGPMIRRAPRIASPRVSARDSDALGDIAALFPEDDAVVHRRVDPEILRLAVEQVQGIEVPPVRPRAMTDEAQRAAPEEEKKEAVHEELKIPEARRPASHDD